MNKHWRNLINLAAILFSVAAVFGFNTAAAAVPFGPQEAEGKNFGDGANSIINNSRWVDGSVRQVNGDLFINDNGKEKMLGLFDFSNEFIYSSMLAATKDGRIMTREEIEQMATAIIEKYLLDIDSWPGVEASLFSWGLSSDEIKKLRTKFENSMPTVKGMEKMADELGISLKLSNGKEVKFPKAGNSATSIAGKYEPRQNRFLTESASYKYGVLIDKYGKEIIPENNPYLYQRWYSSTGLKTEEVNIVGDISGLARLDKAVAILNDPSKNSITKILYSDQRNTDGTKTPDFYNCTYYTRDTQQLLADNDVVSYAVSLMGYKFKDGAKYGHMAIAIEVGSVRYPDGGIFPTFAVIEPQTGYVIGQLGGKGDQINNAYDDLRDGMIVENAAVFKDFEIVDDPKREATYINTGSSQVFTYSGDYKIDIDNSLIKIGGVAGVVTGLPESKSVSISDLQFQRTIIDEYGPELENGEKTMSICYSAGGCSYFGSGISISDINSQFKNEDIESAAIYNNNGDREIIFNFDR